MYTSSDLRYPVKQSKKYDLILCLEVAEHLPDIPTTYFENSNFVNSGTMGLLNNIANFLSEEGYCFLTTPNVTSYACVCRILAGKDPFSWLKHIREYSISSFTKLIQEAGLSIKVGGAIDFSRYSVPSEICQSIDLLTKAYTSESGFNQIQREDSQFYFL